MRILFEPNGRLTFVIGFEGWNPAKWRYDSAAAELKITIPNLPAGSYFSFEDAAVEGEIRRFDAGSKTIAYEYADTTRQVSFQGIVYYPEDVWKRNCLPPNDATTGNP